jgi:hypothetical protein
VLCGKLDQQTQGHVARYIFQECMRHATVADKHGENAVRYPYIVLRCAIMLRLKMGVDKYEFLRQAFHLPSARTISDYSSPCKSKPDDILYPILAEKQHQLFDHHKIKDREMSDDGSWIWHGSLAWDSMTIQYGLVFDPHTMQLVGFGKDALEPSVILSESNRLGKSNTNQPIVDTEVDNTARAKHYLAFFFTLLNGKGAPMKFCGARYALRTMDATFIQNTVLKVNAVLSCYGFIVDILAADGASKNRSANKMMATITAKDIFSDMFSEGETTEYPLDMKVASHHPTRPSSIIFIGGDMPHLIKKCVNALERSGKSDLKTDLLFKGKKLSLAMLHELWKICGDADGPSSLRNYPFTADHFENNSYNRMRVYLSVQITSHTMIETIKRHAEDMEGGLKAYSSMIEVIDALDRLIDIFNCTDMGRHKNTKGARQLIHHPTIISLSC